MRMGDIARVARARPRAQQAGALAGVALLASAPFGGWSAVEAPGPGTWSPGQPFVVGPFEVTVDRAVTVADLGATIRPATKGNHLLAVVAKVENVSERMAYLTLLTAALRPRDAGIVDTDPTTPPGVSAPQVYIIKDTSQPRLLNPHVGVAVALVWEQEPGQTGRLPLDVLGYDFVEESGLTLDSNFWLLDDTVAMSGEVAVTPVASDG